MAGKAAMLRSQQEREMDKNLLENQAQLFDAKTPAPPTRRSANKLLTSKEVDAFEQFYKSKKSNSTQPPSQPVRFVFDHISISRRTSRQAAQETTKRVKEDVRKLSSRRILYSRDQTRRRPVEVIPKKVQERQAILLEAGRVNHCHLCAKYMRSGWIPCSRCEERFHYLCLKRQLNINTSKFTKNWLCPVCRKVCNCADCRDSGQKLSNGLVRRLQRNGDDWRRGSEDVSGVDVGIDQGGQKNVQRRPQRKQLRSIVGEKQDGSEDMGPKLSSREQPRRAAVQVKRGRVREVESLGEDEDDWVTPSTLGPKREHQSERRKENYVNDVESGEDGDEVENEGDVDMSGEDVDSDGDEDEYVNRYGRRNGGTLPHLQGST
ncbi:hypothetical protein EC957_010784 [Mortierella hygrophila]|uniref:Zinc-finger domain-containing protein n=1 Tax=Mortierella hygrophila TaxID=979708 RepID=A0A9P6FIR5_9FUNG|nr:hypothetical protein EC957_010784 [Mortierella hygrophila]